MTWLATHFEIVLLTLLTLIAAVVILQQRRTPQSAVAWLLFIVIVPYVAIPLFLVLGFRKGRAGFDPIVFTAVPTGDLAGHPVELANVLQRFGMPGATDGNRFDLLETPQAAGAALSALVAEAQQSLDALFYIIADDQVGTDFVDALTAKAQDGIRVRLLIDRLGTLRPPRHALARLKAAGGEVRFFSPLVHKWVSGHLNLRNHRKMVIADGNKVFAGGMNVSANYMGQGAGTENWTDLAYLIEGPAVSVFGDVFRSDWAVNGGDGDGWVAASEPVRSGQTTAQLAVCGPDMAIDPLHDALVHAIHGATTRVWIATPYFLPTELLNNALVIAARRGVDVRILLPQRSNQHLADFARGAYLRDMQEAGCKVLLFKPGMMHAKAGVVDDSAWVGSANFDIRSMLLNFETVLFVYDAGTVAKLAGWFARQEAFCTQGLKPVGLMRQVLEGMFRLGAPVL